jgi:hypothetical protein
MIGIYRTGDIKAVPFSEAPLLSVAMYLGHPYLLCEALDGQKCGIAFADGASLYALENSKKLVAVAHSSDQLAFEVLSELIDFERVPYGEPGWLLFTERGAAVSTQRKLRGGATANAYVSLVDGKEISPDSIRQVTASGVKNWKLFWGFEPLTRVLVFDRSTVD